MYKFTKIGFCVVFLLGLFACSTDKNFPDEPALTSRDFDRISNDRAIWTIGFTDGDGDIGVRNANDSDNFFVTIFNIKEGKSESLPGQSFRIPVVENIRTEKGIEGTFEFEIELDFLSPEGDSFQYSGFVRDRSLNESNVVFSPVFSVN